MSANTKIEWCSASWNPVTGCTKVSQGCKNCYAERMAKRLKAMGMERYRNGFAITMHDDLVDLPRKWKKSRLVFVNSMSDLFHPTVPLDFIQKVFHVMNECPQHNFQVLTKRSERLMELAPHLTWTPNIWMGVSVENADVVERVHHLQQVPAHVRFLSVEPLIGPIDELPLQDIHWVIVGGESGPGARPIKSDWVESLHAQCGKADVPFFFKQWGGVRKDRTGRELFGRTFDEMPRIYRRVELAIA